jgi:hypothetical protein
MDFTALATYLDGKLINAFDASTLAFSDDAKTTLCGNDDPVYRWGSSGGISSLDCYQATLAKRPLYKSDYDGNGYPALLLDGTDDWMQINSLGDADYTDDFATFVVGPTLATATKTFAGRGVTGGLQFGYFTSTTGTQAQVNTSGGLRGSGAVRSLDQQDGVWGFGFSAGRSLGSAALSVQSIYNAGETTVADTSNWYLGTYNAAALLGNIAVRGFVLCQGLTAAEYAATHFWLAEQYGYGETISSGGGTAGFTGIRGLSRRLGT